MNERQLTVCAIALFADGFSFAQIGQALRVTEEEASSLAFQGAEEQRAGRMVSYGRARLLTERQP